MSSTVTVVTRRSRNSISTKRQIGKPASPTAEPDPISSQESSPEMHRLPAEEHQKLIDSQWEDCWSI